MTEPAPGATLDDADAPLGDRLDDMRLSGLARLSAPFKGIWNRIPAGVRNFWPFRIIASIISLVRKNRVLSLSAEISFWGVLSVVPLAIAAGSALGWLDTIAGTAFADDAKQELTEVVKDIFGTNGTASSIEELFNSPNGSALTLSLLISVYSASRGFTSLIGALGLISGHQSQRNWLMTRVVGVFVSIVSIIIMNGMLILLGLNRGGLGLPNPWNTIVGYGIFPVIFVIIVGWALVLLHWAPQDRTGVFDDLPGAALTAIFWIAGSYLTAIYIAQTAASSDPVGLLGSGLGLLIWLYVISSSILIGAQLNAAIQLDSVPHSQAPSEAFATQASPQGESLVSAGGAASIVPPRASSEAFATQAGSTVPQSQAPSEAFATQTSPADESSVSTEDGPSEYPEPHWADS